MSLWLTVPRPSARLYNRLQSEPPGSSSRAWLPLETEIALSAPARKGLIGSLTAHAAWMGDGGPGPALPLRSAGWSDSLLGAIRLGP